MELKNQKLEDLHFFYSSVFYYLSDKLVINWFLFSSCMSKLIQSRRRKSRHFTVQNYRFLDEDHRQLVRCTSLFSSRLRTNTNKKLSISLSFCGHQWISGLGERSVSYSVFSALIGSSAALLTVLVVFPALAGLETSLFSCILNHLHFRSCRALPCSQAGWQSILMFATVHWLPNSPTAWWRQHSRTSTSCCSASGLSSAGLIAGEWRDIFQPQWLPTYK